MKQAVGTTLKGLAVAFIFSVIIVEGTGYLVTFSPVISLMFGVIVMLTAVTAIIWVISKDIYK